MPQVFHVLRCFKCAVFQVHQVKKSNKWECKLCGIKQSIKRHYGIGTAKDCRIHVQKLNSIRGEIDEMKCGQMKRNQSEDEEDEIENLELHQTPPQIKLNELPKESKWTDFVDKEEPQEDSNEPMCLGDTEVVLEIPKKRRKQTGHYTRQEGYNNKSKWVANYSANEDIISNKQTEELSANGSELDCNAIPSLQEQRPVSHILAKSKEIKKDNCKPKIPPKKFVPPTINKSSKWAQYAEEEDCNETDSCTLTMSQNVLMFSQCDDSELDNVLDL